MKVVEIPKTTGTYADTLRAIGTADLLEEISGSQAIIKDMGSHFQIVCLSDIVPDQLKQPSPGYYYLWRKSKEKERPKGDLVLDYEEEKSKADAIKKSGSKKKKATLDKALAEQGLIGLENVHHEYRPAAILESMRKGWTSDKDIYKWVVQNPVEALKWGESELLNQSSIKPPVKVSNSQFFNPSSGKGVHAGKTRYKSPGAISNEVVEPFAEWMKYRGAYSAMLPYRNKHDFKLFVIEPSEIWPKALAVLRNRLLSFNLWGGIRLDIEATLQLTKELIMHSDVVQGDIRLRGKRPSEIVKGLRQAFFKSMGTAAALMNDAFLPLPDWFCIENKDDANAFLGIIKEHIGYYENGQRKQGCLGSLDENHSGDVPLLQQYRKWLATTDKFDLLEFFTKFALHIIERRGKKEWVKEFSTENLNILFGRGYGMKEIVENEGFVNIANAIRNSTVSSFENVKSGWKGSGYETQFGMAQEWKQKIKGGKQAFIPALSDFVQKHNWEAVHKLKKSSPPISQEDLSGVMRLIDQYGVELVGMTLLAYGYARASRIETESTSKKEGK